MAKIYKGTNTGPGPQSVMVINGEYKHLLRHRVRHSPDGFQWGYGGSGPAELARCILFDLLGKQRESFINSIYQEFKRKFIETADKDLEIKAEDIDKWLSDEFHFIKR